ncbi:hypothetical protein C0J52_21264 [Blattella germanica]|nr:hypothetical protein C0J52_21264 [Blattella germanica]
MVYCLLFALLLVSVATPGRHQRKRLHPELRIGVRISYRGNYADHSSRNQRANKLNTALRTQRPWNHFASYLNRCTTGSNLSFTTEAIAGNSDLTSHSAETVSKRQEETGLLQKYRS